jgi:hypothetical protein
MTSAFVGPIGDQEFSQSTNLNSSGLISSPEKKYFGEGIGFWIAKTINLSRPSFSRPIVNATSTMVSNSPITVSLGKVDIDREQMVVKRPYPFWLEDVFLVAVKQEDGSVEFYSLR